MTSIAIVGAGPAGLAMGKALRDVGLRARIFEASSHLGGIWSPSSQHCRPSMRTNISRHSCSFSDHPWPSGTNTFPPARELGIYLETYARKFGVFDDISFGCRINRITRTKDNRWNVTWLSDSGSTQDPIIPQESHETFTFLVVASGFFAQPYMPDTPGLDKASFSVIHSSQYRDPDSFDGKRVAIIGNSFSAGEVASDISTHAAHIAQIVPQSFWMIPRYLPIDPTNPATPFLPMDLASFRQSPRRSPNEIRFPTEEDTQRRVARLRALVGERGYVPNHSDTRSDQPQFIAVCDNNTEAIRAGKMSIRRGRLSSARGSTLFLEDGTSIQDVDAVIMATGFIASLEFLDREILDIISYDASDKFLPLLLHKSVFHPDLPNAAFVGMYRGPYFGVMELQARWVAAILSGRLAMPSREVQLEGIDIERQLRESRPRMQFPHADYVGLANDLFTELDLGPVPSSPSPIVTASYYRPDSLISQEMRRDLCAEVEASKGGKWVAAAVFRALLGTWTLSRRLESAHTMYPSGDLKGTATFTSISEHEYGYLEEGQLITDRGMKLETKRRYKYKYDEGADRIDVFFDDQERGSGNHGFFHSLKILRPDEQVVFPHPAQPKVGWRAIGEHLCIEDFYESFYDFTFSGVDLEEFGITFKVKGPQKDYVLAARYTR